MTHNLYLFTQTSYRLLNFFFDRLNTTSFSDKQRRDKLRLLFDRSVCLHDKYSRLFRDSDLAVVATSSPDSAILENAVVETVQGTSIFNPLVICQDCLKVESYTDDKHDGVITCLCGGDFCGCFSCNLHAFKLQSDSYQSIIESIPLSAYEDYQDDYQSNLNWAGFDDVAQFPDVVVYHFERVGG